MLDARFLVHTHPATMVVLTQEQADAAMAANTTWPFPGTSDGWYLAHGGLRLDMAGAGACQGAVRAHGCAYGKSVLVPRDN